VTATPLNSAWLVYRSHHIAIEDNPLVATCIFYRILELRMLKTAAGGDCI
jgi:hypothetical protein